MHLARGCGSDIDCRAVLNFVDETRINLRRDIRDLRSELRQVIRGKTTPEYTNKLWNAFLSDNEEEVLFLLDKNEDLISKDGEATSYPTFLHIALLHGCQKIAESLLTKSLLSFIRPWHHENENNVTHFYKENLNIMNTLYILAESGYKDPLLKLFRMIESTPSYLHVGKLDLLRLLNLPCKPYKFHMPTGRFTTTYLSCLDVMTVNNHMDMLKMVFDETIDEYGPELFDTGHLLIYKGNAWAESLRSEVKQQTLSNTSKRTINIGNTKRSPTESGRLITSTNYDVPRAKLQLHERPTLLMYAARCGHAQLVEELLNRVSGMVGSQHTSFLWNISDYVNRKYATTGFTALHFSIYYNHVDVVRLLLEKGKADVNEATDGCLKFPIAFAAALGHSKVVDLLLPTSHKHIAEALRAAAGTGECTAAEILLQSANVGRSSASAHPDVHVDDPDLCGNTALLIAARGNHIGMIELLLLHQASLEAENSNGDCVWDMVNEAGNNSSTIGFVLGKLRDAGSDLCSGALNNAVASENLELLSDILQDDSNSLLKEQLTFIQSAAMLNKHIVLETFLSRYRHLATTQAHCALFLAAERGHLQAVDVLLKDSTIDLGWTDENGRSALHRSLQGGHFDVAELIITVAGKQKGIDIVNLRDYDEMNTALHLAITQQNRNCIKRMQSCSEPNLRNRRGYVAISMAAAVNNNEILQLVLDLFYSDRVGNRLDDENEDGLNALMICVRNGNVDGVKLLLEYGANAELTTIKNGHNVSHVLAYQGFYKPDVSVQLWNVIAEFFNDKYGYREARKRLFIMTRLVNDTATFKVLSRGSISVGRMTAVQIASTLGEVELLRAMLDSTSHFSPTDVLHAGKTFLDITQLVPQTCLSPMKVSGDNRSTKRSSAELKFVNTRRDENDGENFKPCTKSCLELIADNCGSDEIQKLLQIESLKAFVSLAVRIRTFMYLFMLFAHVVFMSYFTYCAIPTRDAVALYGKTSTLDKNFSAADADSTSSSSRTVNATVDAVKSIVVTYFSNASDLTVGTSMTAQSTSTTSSPTVTAYVMHDTASDRASEKKLSGFESIPNENVLIWPAILLLIELSCAVSGAVAAMRRWTHESRSSDTDSTGRGIVTLEDEFCDIRCKSKCKTSESLAVRRAELSYRREKCSVSTISNVMFHVAVMCFVVTFFMWYIYALFDQSSAEYAQYYVLISSITLIFGWLLPLELMRGVHQMHVYVMALKLVYVLDVFRMGPVFLLTVVGFSSAMYLFILLERSGVAGSDINFMSVAFDIDAAGFGQGSLYGDVSTGEAMSELLLGNAILVKLIFLFYFLSAITVLSNLLVAMMNTTYSSILGIGETLWCIDGIDFVVSASTRLLSPAFNWHVRNFIIWKFEETSTDVEANVASGTTPNDDDDEYCDDVRGRGSIGQRARLVLFAARHAALVAAHREL